MAKAFLSRDTAERIRAARAGSTEKEADKPVSANNAPPPPVAQTYTAPIPIPKPAMITPSSSPAPSPPQIQQVIIYSQDNTALLREQADKERILALYKAEQAARATSQEKHKEQVTKHEQLVKEDASLKRRHDIALKEDKVKEETIQRIMQEKEQLAQENEALKLELEKAKKIAEEIKLASKEEIKKEEVAVPPSYDAHEKTDVIELASDNNASYNDVPLTGDIAPESPAEDGANDKCIVS